MTQREWGSKSGKGARVYSVDPHPATPLYWVEHGGVPLSNLTAAGVLDIVVPLQEPSLRAVEYLANQPVGVVGAKIMGIGHDVCNPDEDRVE